MENRVFLYSRVSTDSQTLEQQERTVYEWLSRNNMSVSDVVSDEGVSGGVSYKDRNLGKILLPMLQAGDAIIVSEISRLGRSMYDINTLIHTELKPRKIRLIIVSMGIDLRCDKLTTMDELVLNQFSFAAQLEKQLLQERTLSALRVRKMQGVKLGGASDKWKDSYNNKTKEQLDCENMQRGLTKTKRHIESRDIQAFIKVVKNVFPEAITDENMTTWDLSVVNTKGENKKKIISLMKDLHDIDGKVFAKWDFDNMNDRKMQVKLSGYIDGFKRSVRNYIRFSV